MGFFKKILGDVADELKKNLEDAKNEMLSNLEEVKQDVKAGFTNSTSNSRDDDEEDDEEPKILLGDFHDGVLTIREGITELDDESLEHYKRIRKIIFPASLERLDSNVIDEQERLEELDFSKVTKLKTIPDDFISGENKIRKLIIPNGVTEVGDGFLGETKSGAEIFVPASVTKLGYITGNNDNDMTVYLFVANIDISDVEQDVKTLYVLPDYYGYYAKQLKECYSEANLREMPDDKMDIYGEVSKGTPTEKIEESNQQKQNSAPAVDEAKPEEETNAEAKEEIEQKEEPIENGGLFSARIEAMIAAALQDGVLTDKERELLKRRVEKEGEDWDEVEMIIEARLAEKNPVTVPAPAPESESEPESASEPEPEPDGEQTENVNDKRYPEEYYKKMKLVEILPFINRRLSDIESHTLRPWSKIDAFRYLNKLSEIVPETEMSIATFIACAEFYETDGFFDDPEAKIRELLQIEGILQNAEEKEQMKLQTILDYSKAKRYSNERNVDIPEGYIELGVNCFKWSDLQSICLPSTLKKINDKAFYGCNKMKKVDFSKCTSLIEIGDNVFYLCKKLEEIVLPDSVKTIGDGAFEFCEKLRKIVMPSSLEELGDRVFMSCDSLEEVDMSKVTKLTTIPKRFKTGDDKQMVIPMGVTTIRKDAFKICNMYDLFLPPTLKDYMDTNGSWESVYLFASPLEKMDNIFENSKNLYVLPQYLDVYKSIHEALGYSRCEIHTMPDEFMFFYDN